MNVETVNVITGVRPRLRPLARGVEQRQHDLAGIGAGCCLALGVRFPFGDAGLRLLGSYLATCLGALLGANHVGRGGEVRDALGVLGGFFQQVGKGRFRDGQRSLCFGFCCLALQIISLGRIGIRNILSGRNITIVQAQACSNRFHFSGEIGRGAVFILPACNGPKVAVLFGKPVAPVMAAVRFDHKLLHISSARGSAAAGDGRAVLPIAQRVGGGSNTGFLGLAGQLLGVGLGRIADGLLLLSGLNSGRRISGNGNARVIGHALDQLIGCCTDCIRLSAALAQHFGGRALRFSNCLLTGELRRWFCCSRLAAQLAQARLAVEHAGLTRQCVFAANAEGEVVGLRLALRLDLSALFFLAALLVGLGLGLFLCLYARLGGGIGSG